MADHIMKNFLLAVQRAFHRGITQFLFMGAPVTIEKLDGVQDVWVACTACGAICSLRMENNKLAVTPC